MYQALLGCLLIANLLEVAFSSDLIPALVVKSIYEKCSLKTEQSWTMNVTILQSLDSTENSHGGGLYHPRPVVIIPEGNTSDYSEQSVGEGGLIDWANYFVEKLRRKRKKMLKSLCSVIPEPIVIPDLNLTSLLTFRAYNGRISGIRKICIGHELPQILVKDSRIGFRHELNLGGLHFRYHITDKRLRIDRKFSWTLSNHSFAVVSIMAGLNKKCILNIKDLGLYLDFDGTDRGKKCTGGCYSILAKLRCYFFHFFSKAVRLLIRALMKIAKTIVCVSPRGIDLRLG